MTMNKRNVWFLLAAALTSLAVMSAKGDVLSLSNTVWRAQKTTPEAILANETPAEGKWTERKQFVHGWKADTEWRETSVLIPASWRGKRVQFMMPPFLSACDLVVYLNGKRAGDVLRPYGDVEAAAFLRYGETNTIRILVTPTGEGTRRGKATHAKNFHGLGSGPKAVPYFRVSEGTCIEDVFANTSWRKKSLSLETEISSDRARKVLFRAEVLDQEGKVVKTVGETVQVRKGLTEVKSIVAWENPVTWEPGRGYLYTCRAWLEESGRKVYEYAPFTFGFREVWRVGKELYMNGHPLRLRISYPYGANEYGMRLLMDVGFNIIIYTHSFDAVPTPGEETLQCHDRLGLMASVSAGNAFNIASGMVRNEEDARAYEAYIKKSYRVIRNHPSAVVYMVGLMNICDIGFSPSGLTRAPASGGNHDVINKAAEISRRYQPNVVYFSHADGPNADIHSGNMYLCWTPLQEQLEWLTEWSKAGKLPWMAVEFLSPYPGDYWNGTKHFAPTEHVAELYGDRVYAEEPEELLQKTLSLSIRNRAHGVDPDNLLIYPWFWPMRRAYFGQINKYWRAYGHNASKLWFDLDHAIGVPPKTRNRYAKYKLDEPVFGRPEWASLGYDIHQIGNKDFCGVLGGLPEPPERTHGYYGGSSVEKQVVMIWDHFTPQTFTAEWRVILAGTKISEGVIRRDMKPGEIYHQKFAFSVPVVQKKEKGRIEVAFKRGRETVDFEKFDFEVYPAFSPRLAPQGEVVLLQKLQDKTAAGILSGMGIPFREIKALSPEEIGGAKYLVVGKDALEGRQFEFGAERVTRDGLNVLILPQMPEVWQTLGFEVEDQMVRRVFLRDKANPAFAGISEEMLGYWKGTPVYGEKKSGALMVHAGQRGPRGPRTHTVAGVILRIPECGVFNPLFECGFDLGYSPLIESRMGKGSVTYCTLDFENRIGVDPAATLVARGMFQNFFTQKAPVVKRAFALGKSAEGLLDHLLFAKAESKEKADVLVAGPDYVGTYETLRSAGKEKELLIFSNGSLAKEAGFGVVVTNLYRALLPARVSAQSLLRGIGPQLARWRDAVTLPLLSGSGVEAGGILGVKKPSDGVGRVVFSQVPFGQLAARYAQSTNSDDVARVKTLVNSEENILRYYASLLRNLGVAPAEKLAKRQLVCAGESPLRPLPGMHILGPYNVFKDNSKLMLDTLFEGEKYAVAGDFNPNIEFKLPQGGTANWRPFLIPDDSGKFALSDFVRGNDYGVYYAICRVTRKKAGEAILKFGCDWRAKIWLNGAPVFRSERGSHNPSFEIRLKMKEGENILSFKIGSGRQSAMMIGLLEAERMTENRIDVGDLRYYRYGGSKRVDSYLFFYW